MEVFFGVVYLLVVGVIWYRNRRKVKVGVLHDQNGQAYPYALGNYLASKTTEFHGIDITLPGTMANFYLDSHKDSRRRGPRRLFDAQQKLSLEGDFDRYFQLFVPKGNEALVLSILSPDVMSTLMRSSERYDVELYDNHLYLISLQRAYGNFEVQPQLIEAAEVLLNEIAHRQRSWQPADQPVPHLVYSQGQTFKLAGWYVRRSRAFIVVGFVLASVVAIGFSLSGYYTYQDPHFNDPFSKGIVQGSFMYAAAAIFIAAIPLSILGTLLWLVGYRSTPDSWPKKRVY